MAGRQERRHQPLRRRLLKSRQNRKDIIRRMHAVAKEMSEQDIAARERIKAKPAAGATTTAAGNQAGVSATAEKDEN